MNATDPSTAEPLKKRNCGHTGPTSATGRAKSALNSTKHGSCAETLILIHESAEAWQVLLHRWLKTYQPEEDSLDHDFVLKTAQAEWYRIRNQRSYDDFLCSTSGINPFNWTPEQVIKHDLLLRYKTTAERAFQREYRLLQQHLKSNPKLAEESQKEEKTLPATRLISQDDSSPTGYFCQWERPMREDITYPYPVPPPTTPHPSRRPPIVPNPLPGEPNVVT